MIQQQVPHVHVQCGFSHMTIDNICKFSNQKLLSVCLVLESEMLLHSLFVNKILVKKQQFDLKNI